MAKGIYIGVDSKARKVKKAYVGVAEETITKEELTEFTSNPMPTSWSLSSDELIATATNDYGKWTIESTIETGVATRTIDKMFDGDATTYFNSNNFTANQHEYINITTPSNVLILPKTINIKTLGYGSAITAKLEMYDNDSGTWVSVGTIERNVANAITYNGNVYSNMFRIDMVSTSNNYAFGAYSFEITEGTIKKVTKGQVGIARKVKKGYIGVGGVARLFYSAETLVPFTSSPAPTTGWTDSSDNKSATATNQYGEWSLSTSITLSSSYKTSYAVDSSTSTAWANGTSSNTSLSWNTALYFDPPTGVTINPKKISVVYKYTGNSSDRSTKIQGYNGSAWVTLASLSVVGNTVTTSEYNIDVEEYYSRFRILAYPYSTSQMSNYIYDFKITSGTLKIE